MREVALVTHEVLSDVGLVGWPKTSGSRGIHVNVRIEPSWTFDQVRRAALAIAREVERRAPSIATSKWWKEERHGVFLDYNQNAKDRTVASAYSVRPLPDARVSMPLRWEQVADVEAAEFTLATVPAIYARDGDAHAGIDEAIGRLDDLLELSERHEKEGLGGDAPWPPNYRKQEAEPPRVQPSRQKRADADYNTPEAEAAREKSRAAMERRFERAAAAKRSPTGRRVSKKPLVEIARAAKKDEALAGLERWQERHTDVVPPRAGGHPDRLDARPKHDLDAHPGQPRARARGATACAGAARGRLRPVGRLRVGGSAGQAERAPRKKGTS